MNHPPLVSILIPCFNAQKTLPKTLASLKAQTYQNWEAILVDDGSAQSLDETVQKANDERIFLKRLETNKGRAAARQEALNLARGQYITMVDADDWIMPTKLEEQVHFLIENPDIGVVATNMLLISDNGTLEHLQDFSYNASNSVQFTRMKKPSPLKIPHAPSMIRAEIAKRHKYDLELKSAEDADYLLKILLKNKYAILNRPLYVYRYESNRTLKRIQDQLKDARKIYWKYVSTHPLSSLKHVLHCYQRQFLYFWADKVGLLRSITHRNFEAPNQALQTEFEISSEKIDRHF